MNLKYYLTPTYLTERAQDRMALPLNSGTLNQEAIINLILERGTSMTRTDILAVLNILREVVVSAVTRGHNINMPLFNISYSFSGLFDRETDSYDPTRHKVNVNLTKGIALRAAEGQIRPEKVDAPAQNPRIKEVKDSFSGQINNVLTAGGMIDVVGRSIKIDGDNSACGLWFIAEDGTQTKAPDIAENKPSRIIAQIPSELTVGNYQVKIVTQFSGSHLLKEPREFVYRKALTLKKN